MATSLVIVLTILLAGLPGLGMILYGAVSDRRASNHRRPRCRRCLYSLEGLATQPPATCPECGFIAAKHRHLYFTKLRRLPMLVGVLLLIALIQASLIVLIEVPRALPTRWLLHVVTTDHGTHFFGYEEELQRRANSGRLSKSTHDRLAAWGEAVVRRLAVPELGTDPDDIPRWDFAPCLWIIAHPDQQWRHQSIAKFLESTDRPTQTLALRLVRSEVYSHGAPSTIPESWREPLLSILQADAHDGLDVAVFWDVAGAPSLPATDALVHELLRRAASPCSSWPDRGYALIAIEHLARHGRVSPSAVLPALIEMLSEDSPHHSLFSAVAAFGPDAAPAVPALQRWLDHPRNSFFAGKSLDSIQAGATDGHR